MDQFEEINRKNARILKSILAVPLILAVLLVATFLYYLPTFLKLADMYEAQDQALNDDMITDAELDDYISRMEGDGEIMNSHSMLMDRGYNITLVSLYLADEGYDKAIDRIAKINEEDDCILYNYYLGVAYFNKDELAKAEEELDKFINYDFEGAAWEEDTDALLLASSMVVDAEVFLDLIMSYEDLDKMVSEDIITQEEAEAYKDFLVSEEAYEENVELDLAFIEFYIQEGSYEKAIDRARTAIRKGDDYRYHYYLALAYSRQGKKESAASEMHEYLEEDEETYSNIVLEFNSIVRDRQAYDSLGDDMDKDGLGDMLEILLFLDPDSKDSDGDTYEDGSEFLYGFNPSDTSPGDELTGEDYNDLNAMVIFSLLDK